ncbi:MAG: hypothetical protein K8J08_12125, partial [Thermoanaerobaculia bacterium]|nr:hypothetical protein [Thermoanaerobaculia bacterium]
MNIKTLICFLGITLVASMALAGPPTCPMPIQSIADVQASVDAGSPTGASLCDGQAVSLQGIVYAVYGGNTPSFAFADAAGAWNGLYVYGPPTVPSVGDEVTVQGTIQEFNGLTEISFPTSVSIDSTGNSPYAPTLVTTAMIATGAASAESFEGVFVEVADVDITDDNLGFGEWQIDDGSGVTRVDDLGAYCYRPVAGNSVSTLRGMQHYSFDNFKLEPQNDCDFLEFGCSGAATAMSIPAIQGSGPSSPSVSEVVETTGVVTGHFEGNYPGFTFFDGFFIQDPTGDGNSATSDGLFVISDTVPTIGNSVTVQGVVGEFGEFDGTGCFDGCVTMVCAVDIADGGAGAAITATPWTPPTDTDGEYEYHESLEGMVVSIAGSAKVVGPTSFGALFVVDDSEGVDRVLRG